MIALFVFILQFSVAHCWAIVEFLIGLSKIVWEAVGLFLTSSVCIYISMKRGKSQVKKGIKMAIFKGILGLCGLCIRNEGAEITLRLRVHRSAFGLLSPWLLLFTDHNLESNALIRPTGVNPEDVPIT